MVDIKEWPRRWDDQRIQRQFTEKVKKEVIASLQHIRSSSTRKPLPSRLKGFDAEIEGKYHFFTQPSAPSTFADTIEAYLKANDRDKDGKKKSPSLPARLSSPTVSPDIWSRAIPKRNLGSISPTTRAFRRYWSLTWLAIASASRWGKRCGVKQCRSGSELLASPLSQQRSLPRTKRTSSSGSRRLS